MSKNLKKIIAIALAIGTVSAAAPATTANLLTTKAFAANDDADELDSIDLQDDDGDSIDLYTDSGRDDELDDDLSVGKTYYAESSTDQISIDSVDGADDDKVRIFVGSDDYEVGDSIDLDDGTTTIKVRVYEDDYDEDEDYSTSDYNQYTIKVEYNEDDDDDDDDDDEDNDEDELDSLKLLNKSDKSMQLYSSSSFDSGDKVDYDDVEEGKTYYVKSLSNVVSVDTSGPDDDYVKIFDSTSSSAEGVDPGDDISLKSDKTLTVRIYDEEPDSDITYGDDDDVIGEYKIHVNYIGGTNTTTATTTANTATTVTTAVKANQWVQVSGGLWQYNDSLGKPLANTWFDDRNLGKRYFLNTSGYMATGWLNYGGNWYYLGTDGAMRSNCWILDGTKYYYLYQDGTMAANTTVSGYTVGSDGAWIGR